MKRLISLLVLILSLLMICGCQSSKTDEKEKTTDSSVSPETETTSELIGSWISSQEIGNTSIELTYTFNKDMTYKEDTIADGIEQTVEGTYEFNGQNLILTPTSVNGVDEEDYVVEHGIDEDTQNNSDYIFKPVETTVSFGDDDTLTLTVDGGTVTFNKKN